VAALLASGIGTKVHWSTPLSRLAGPWRCPRGAWVRGRAVRGARTRRAPLRCAPRHGRLRTKSHAPSPHTAERALPS
jgi:hypothetical protein